jgi:uncharacterized protein YodC (DUF2158 family)
MDLKIGDVVRLKSGGPKMTIAEIGDSDDKRVKCIWFDGNKKNEDIFEEAIIAIAEPTTPVRIV